MEESYQNFVVTEGLIYIYVHNQIGNKVYTASFIIENVNVK